MIKLYIIEDHSVILDGIKLRLRHHADEFSITGNSTSIDAFVQKALPDTFDIILLDLWIPGSDPEENISRIKKLFPSKPVVIYTSETSPYWIRVMMNNGARAYLLKSVDTAEFKDTLRKVFLGETVTTILLQGLSDKLTCAANTGLNYLLKPSERAILKKLILGESVKTIAADRNVTVSAIEKTIKKLKNAYGADTDVQLIRMLTKNNII